MLENIKYNKGDKVGKLTVLSYFKKPYNKKGYMRGYYHCLCACGKEVDIDKYRLEKGVTKSCGCLRSKSIKINVNDVFGDLTVIEEIRKENKRGYKEFYYKCRCSCGNENIVRKYDLLSGNTKSCGCKSSRLYMGTLIKEYKKQHRCYPKSLKNIVLSSDLDKIESKEINAKDSIVVTCSKCGKSYTKLLGNICYTTDSAKYKSKCLCPTCSGRESKLEQEIYDYLSSIYPNSIEQNKRGLIPKNPNLELDIYIPELRIGIEVNGLYWHSTKGSNLISPKEKNYHIDKWKICKKNNIFLISIYEQDWVLKQNKIKSFLKNVFSPKQKIYARETFVKEINPTLLKRNLDLNITPKDIIIGLFSKKEDILYSFLILTPLKTKNYYDLKYHVVTPNISIVGGASKLFSFFKITYKPTNVVAYSDNDYSLGTIFPKLGFSETSIIDVSQWVFKNLNITIQDYNSTLVDNYMIQLGFYKIYRCGKTKWEYFVK